MDSNFIRDLDTHIAEQLSALDLLKAGDPSPANRSEVVRRLKIALRNEIEASQLAAAWMPSTPEIDVKLAFARQAGDEAKHYRLIEKHLMTLGVDASAFDPLAEGYSQMYQMLSGFQTTVERVAGAQLTRELLALKKNEQFIEFCVAAGDPDTASFYREQIQPDEAWHVDLGRRFIHKYATTAELQGKARKAVQAVLDLAVMIQNKQLKELRLSHAPGC